MMNDRDKTIDALADKFRAYRENPQLGGWESLRAEIGKAARACRMSPGTLTSEVHRRYEERLAAG